ncbi:MAG TPA: fumarylacetoacetate hydrolase family protein [Stellaceae bacterium]|nr:fumarylacetoacetate hydrolase family protein [Stellaceae bacterium]
MRLVTFVPAGEVPRLGAWAEGKIIDLAAALPACPGEVTELLERGEPGMAIARQALTAGLGNPRAWHAPGTVRLLAPVPRPGKILGIGRNYGAHAAEGGLAAQEQPRIFIKLASSVIGTGAPIPKPPRVIKLDYETELAVVIGRRARSVSESEAASCIAGYTILNDVSARELQFDVSPPQTSFAKSMDGFCPMGPALATPDEFADPGNIRLRGFVNGELVQDGSTHDLIFPVPHLIAYLSSYLALEPGDVIATGTPSGVGVFRKPPRFLAPGDVVRMEIAEIGVLENRVVAAD